MSKKLINARLRDLDNAADYTAWKQIARELDRIEGADAWRQDEASDDYDHLLIRERLARMRELRNNGDVRQLVFNLAESLHGNLGNIANPSLHGWCRFGTKNLIEEYTEEVSRCLDYICVGDFPDFGDDEKVLFFKRAGHSFGRSALLLSGGATLGMFHLGVIKALWEQALLPRVLTGSSAGAIIAAMAGTRTDAELPEIFDVDNLSLQAFQNVGLRNIVSSGALMNPVQLENCLARNIRKGSFLQAFERTRRILGVTVSPAQPNQAPRLLNYLTAPNVVTHRAVLASCAVPGVFPPVMLEGLDYSGHTVPYMCSKRWVDGTLSNDLPLLRLARLHNVNHYIVSQTNPHIVPFMREQNGRINRGLLPFARDAATLLSRDVLKLTRQHLGAVGMLGAARIVDQLNEILQQRYGGDISIFPHHTPKQLLHMFSNPSPDEIRRYIREGERATWPKLERIRQQTQISRAFEDCLAWLKNRGTFGRRAAAQRRGHRDRRVGAVSLN